MTSTTDLDHRLLTWTGDYDCRLPTGDYRLTGRGPPGRANLVPGPTPTPRSIKSSSSSFIDDALSAVSLVMRRFMYKVASDWFWVCMPIFSWPACMAP